MFAPPRKKQTLQLLSKVVSRAARLHGVLCIRALEMLSHTVVLQILAGPFSALAATMPMQAPALLTERTSTSTGDTQ